MSYLLDTNIAVHLRDGNAAILSRFAALDRRPYLSVLSRVELESGVYARPELVSVRRKAVDVILDLLTMIDFDDTTAAAYGAIVAQTGFSRRKVIDRMIAATALHHRLTLITCNKGDFDDVPGLMLETW